MKLSLISLLFLFFKKFNNPSQTTKKQLIKKQKNFPLSTLTSY